MTIRQNKLVRRAVERELGIIGEAMTRLLKVDSSIKISSPRRIIDLRNWVIHGYDKVDDVIIWGIIPKAFKFRWRNYHDNKPANNMC